MPVPIVLFDHVTCIPKECMAENEGPHHFESHPPVSVCLHQTFFVDDRKEVEDKQQDDGEQEKFDVSQVRNGTDLLEIEKRMEDLFALCGGALFSFVDKPTNLKHENTQNGQENQIDGSYRNEHVSFLLLRNRASKTP
jgi:hypothetical protein